jgi:hypothetical protein
LPLELVVVVVDDDVDGGSLVLVDDDDVEDELLEGVEVVLLLVARVVVVELVDGARFRVANVVGGSPERSGAAARSMSDVCASRGGS